MTPNDAGIEQFLKGLSWRVKKGDRTLVFNVKIPLVRTNIDLVLLNIDCKDYGSAVIRKPQHFVALGELKGGIDPAGADEHWKTATKALDRIRRAFKKTRHHPALCFIGAAIAQKMANEIWEDLRTGDLANAANLTRENQVASLCNWLCEL
jgi:hypothetical protein